MGRVRLMKIELKFDMPFSLNVEGDFLVKTAGEEFHVTLKNYFEEDPIFLAQSGSKT
jgi:hypothetical protein